VLRRRIIYVQVHKGYFLVRLVGEVEGIRRDCSALSHPRTLAGNFAEIEKKLREIFAEIRTVQMRLRKPIALVHLIPKAEGGYTNIELRAFKDAAESAGASFGWLCDDKYGPLSETQIAEMFSSWSHHW